MLCSHLQNAGLELCIEESSHWRRLEGSRKGKELSYVDEVNVRLRVGIHAPNCRWLDNLDWRTIEQGREQCTIPPSRGRIPFVA
uniref:Uncharacterized protein n=1 Tax=Oryza meridionalis TaxID=40149 RepID=A0A0E0DFH5_9ORYZ